MLHDVIDVDMMMLSMTIKIVKTLSFIKCIIASTTLTTLRVSRPRQHHSSNNALLLRRAHYYYNVVIMHSYNYVILLLLRSTLLLLRTTQSSNHALK